jgi:hypothetical protein
MPAQIMWAQIDADHISSWLLAAGIISAASANRRDFEISIQGCFSGN